MHTDGTKSHLAGGRWTNTLSERAFGLTIDIDPDLEATVLFALLGLTLSLAVLHVIPLGAEVLDLLMTG